MQDKTAKTVVIRGQRFAQFGRLLADLTPFNFETPRGDQITCEPIADNDGNYTATIPDEGRSQLTCRYTNHTRNRVHVGGGPFRWIYADEATATNREIADRSADMLDDGSLLP